MEFQISRAQLDKDGQAGKEDIGSGAVVSIFEKNQNPNQLDLGKTGHILKTIFQYFYYLVIPIRRF